MAGRSKHVRYDIDGSDMLAYGLHSGSFPGRTIFFATLIMTEYPILGSSTKLREQPMKPTKDLFQGAAIASILLHQQLLSLLILKGLFNREEILEHLDSTLLAAEEMQSNLAAARIGGADELSVPAVRAHLESLRTILEVRHPSTDHDGD